MGKFEQAPASAPKPEKSEPKKSRKLSHLIAPAALGIAALVAGKAPEEARTPEKPKATIAEQAKPFHFEMGNLASRFTLKEKKDIKGPRIIFEVTQLHSTGQLSVDHQIGAAHYIIESQKEIEELISYLRETYGVDTFFIEGLDLGDNTGPAFLYKYINNWSARFESLMKSGNVSEAGELLKKFIDEYKTNLAIPDIDEFSKATSAYFLQGPIKKFLPFATPEERGTLEANLAALENHRYLKGDNKYITMGGAWKAWLDSEGKIKLETGDNRAAALEMLAAIRNSPGKDASEETKKTYNNRLVELARIREDAGIASMNSWMDKNQGNKTFQIIGYAHNGTGNVKRYNKGVGDSKRCRIQRLDSNVARLGNSIDFKVTLPLELKDPEDEDW